MQQALSIREDDLTGEAIVQFLQDHLDDMRAISPPESVHALDLSGLRQSDVTFWSATHNEQIVGCGAIKQLDPKSAEIKSMRTHPEKRGLGIASTLLKLIIETAKQRSYTSLLLETGSMKEFAAARALYETHGFFYRPPFGDYKLDPHSVFMEYRL